MWFTPIVSQPVTATATPVVRSFGIEGNSNSIISGQISIVKLDSSRTYVAAGGPFLPTNAAYAPFRSLINSVSTTIIVEADSPIGQQASTTPGTYSWTCPPGVTSVCVVCIGGGGGGASYIANSLLLTYGGITKVMYCYGCTTSAVDSTLTYSTTNVSATATSNYAKSGHGYAKLSYIGS